MALELLLARLISTIGGYSTRNPGCVFKQKDITETIINKTDAPATILKKNEQRKTIKI